MVRCVKTAQECKDLYGGLTARRDVTPPAASLERQYCSGAPTIFNSADVAIVTKMDLAAAVEFDWHSAYSNVRAVRPGMPVFRLSA
jgi:hypothetical protein